jgi:hypothetical protein
VSLFSAAALNDPGVCESFVGFEQNYCQCIQLPVLYPLCCAKSGKRVGSNSFVRVAKPGKADLAYPRGDETVRAKRNK